MKKQLSLIAPMVFLLTVNSLPIGGEKELIIRLEGEIRVLQRQIRDLQESVDKSQGQNLPLVQKLNDNSENTLRALASIEEGLKTSQTASNNNLTGTNSRINRLAEQVTSTDQRLSQILIQINSLKSIAEQQQNTLEKLIKTRNTAEFENPEQLYAFAYGQYVNGNPEKAAEFFQKYIDGYGSTEAADNAQYWIGECFSQSGRNEDALNAFEKVINDYPKSDKLAAAWLKKGTMLLKLERREDGVNALRQVIAQFPKTQEAATATEELTRLGESIQPPVTPAPAQNKPGVRPRPKTGN